MEAVKNKLIEAEQKAINLFDEIEKRNLIVGFKSESQLNEEIFSLSYELFGIKKYWHKRIVRAGRNTLHPYNKKPADLIIGVDDIVFLDFGPIFEDFEADFGRTYVVGTDPYKNKLKTDVEAAWYEVRDWLLSNEKMSGAAVYHKVSDTAKKYGWEFGGELAGHLIGKFPHERLKKGNHQLYFHPGNPNDIFLPDSNGNERYWILEIHFIDRAAGIGGFFEQLLI